VDGDRRNGLQNQKEKTQEKTKNKRPRGNARQEYFLAFILLLFFEQFTFHQWRIYDYYRARETDLGVFDKSNVPMTRYNQKLFTMLRTEVNMTDFVRFVEVDIHDAVRDKRPMMEQATIDNLKKISKETIFSRAELRRYLATYFPERIEWTTIHPKYNDTRERDTHRYYWSAKMAKDLVILTGKESFTYAEVEQGFKDRLYLNYLNELILAAAQTFETLMVEEGDIKDAFFEEHVPFLQRKIPHLRVAKRIQKFLNMDSVYFQFADVINKNSTQIFKEDLSDYNDFRTDKWNYMPVLDPANRTVDSFRSPEDPYLIWEYDFDKLDRSTDRRVRRSYLTQDLGKADQKLKYVYEQRNVNNTFIMRGFHITVRDWDWNVISDEYGPPGPFPGSRETAGKVLWYRPHDYIAQDYILGEELLPTFVMPRSPLFKLEHYDDKVAAVYFQRVKKSHFLPRCLRGSQVTREMMTHTLVRCPHDDHGKTEDAFYEILGIERGKNYFFEFMNVW